MEARSIAPAPILLAYLFLLHVEILDDDTDEEVEREEGSEDDEEDEIQVHEIALFPLRLMVILFKSETRQATNSNKVV